jgi:hypothetical protein
VRQIGVAKKVAVPFPEVLANVVLDVVAANDAWVGGVWVPKLEHGRPIVGAHDPLAVQHRIDHAHQQRVILPDERDLVGCGDPHESLAEGQAEVYLERGLGNAVALASHVARVKKYPAAELKTSTRCAHPS